MIREPGQRDGVAELTVESTETERSAIKAYTKLEHDEVSLDAVRGSHTYWLVC